MGKTAGELESRVRTWLSAHNRQKLTPEHIFELMNEAGDVLADMFDLWFLKIWGSVERSASQAFWETQAIPTPRSSTGAPLTAAQILAGEVPANTEYLRAVPFPDRLLRPMEVYYGPISGEVELSYLYEDEFKATYPLGETAGGTPVAYTLSGDSILLGPCPGFEMELNVRGIYRAQALENDDDENEFTKHAQTLIVYAVQNLIIKYNYEEENRAGLFKEEYAQALRAALAQSGRTHDLARQSRFVRKG